MVVSLAVVSFTIIPQHDGITALPRPQGERSNLILIAHTIGLPNARFTGPAQRHWTMDEHMCAPAPVQPLVRRRT